MTTTSTSAVPRPSCLLEDVEQTVESSTGYIVTSHQLIFTGLCPDSPRQYQC